jgi:hypothetical protein
MGREHAALVWEAHHRMLLNELQQVEQRLAALEAQRTAGSGPPDVVRQIAALQERARELRAQLSALGPSPKAKMG